MLYKKHKYPYGFLAIELAVKLQDFLEPEHNEGRPYQYSSEALEVVDVIVRKRLDSPNGIQNQLAKTLSAMFDCDYQPIELAAIADFMSERLHYIRAHS